MRRILLFIILFMFLFSAQPVFAQGEEPPKPEPSLLEVCIDEGVGACFSQALEEGLLWWSILFVALFVILKKYGEGMLENIKKMGEKDGALILSLSDLNDATKQYLSKATIKFLRFKFRGLPRHIAKNDANRLSLDQAYVSLRIFSGQEKKGEQKNEVKKQNKME